MSNQTIDFPQEACELLRIFDDAGIEAWAVGGCVRDSLLRRPFSDIDFASNASWQQVKSICESRGIRTHETGTKHGTITVIYESSAYEVTTFRSDGAYTDARHPDSVSFVHTIEEDLARRDFTINAIAYRPDKGIVDPYGGREDIASRTIKAVGDPNKRFAEDALRILRACRFSSELGFSIEEQTRKAMVRCKSYLLSISSERITHELNRMLLGPCAGTALLECVDALSAVMPELVAMKGFDQKSPYHAYDVLKHTAKVIDGVPPYPLARWAALFHDFGKPATFFVDDGGVGHFHAHPKLSVPIAEGAMRRLTFSQATMDRVLLLVRHHDDVMQANRKSVKRMLAKLDGDVDLFRSLCDLKRGDARGKMPNIVEAQVEMVNDLERICDEMIRDDEAFCIRDLAINGQDIMNLGVKQGPLIGKILTSALNATIENEIGNTHDELVDFTEKLLHDQSFLKKFKKDVD